ncbi:uncharacterized protein LOC142163170 [Nicotiana tabacum]|uniref:Uncharacterized protein LOC142163170 n=1 Tax=Nicotiana tabacum TaxID=4097 RepID=A0AC58RUY0_TOBAC
MQQASIESSVSFAMEIMRPKMQAEMDRKLQEEREQMAAQLQRNMELELQRKLAEEREQSSVEVDKRIHLEVDKRMHEQFASLMTRMLEQRNPITGEIDTPDKVWEIQHTRKDDRGELVWVDPQSQQIHGQLQEVVTQQQSEEIEHPMTRDEILSTVLGERTGYVHGKGYGKKPPKKSNMQQASVESSVSFAMEIMRPKMQAEMDRKLQEEREQMAAQLQRNMELELQRKLAEEREKSSVEVDKRIHLEVDKRMHEQFASLMTRMLQQVLAPLLLNNSSSFSAFLLPSFGTILLSLAPYLLVNFSFFNFYPLDNRLLSCFLFM